MLIYWRIGNNCNLGCSYCRIVGVRKLSDANNAQPTKKNIDDVISLVQRLCQRNGNSPTYVVLYGGEPLLYAESIKYFLFKGRQLPIKLILHTNGTLLNNVDANILDNMEMILLSVDGNKVTTDKNRGTGTYLAIKNGVKKARGKYHGSIIARSTLTLESSIKNSVLDIIKWLDGVTWQIENSKKHDDLKAQTFLRQYNDDLMYLTKFWLYSMQRGKIINIIPFQAVATTIILGKKEKYLRCGCGSRLVVIDGKKCFSCDELQGKSKDVLLGSIYDDINPVTETINSKVDEVCNTCSIRYICGGRCFNSLMYFSKDKFKFYCEATHLLVKNVSYIIPEILNLIHSGKIKKDDLLHVALDVVDQIP